MASFPPKSEIAGQAERMELTGRNRPKVSYLIQTRTAEVIADKALALPPLDLKLARELIARTRVARVLKDYRDVRPRTRTPLRSCWSSSRNWLRICPRCESSISTRCTENPLGQKIEAVERRGMSQPREDQRGLRGHWRPQSSLASRFTAGCARAKSGQVAAAPPKRPPNADRPSRPLHPK